MKDAIGNELKEGQLVALQLERPLIYGRITKIEHGGVITGMRSGKADVQPTVIVVESVHPIQIDPRISVAQAVIRIVNPEGETAAVALAPSQEEDRPN